MKMKKNLLKNEKGALNLGEFSTPPLLCFWDFSRPTDYSKPPSPPSHLLQPPNNILPRGLTSENLKLLSPLDPKMYHDLCFYLYILICKF